MPRTVVSMLRKKMALLAKENDRLRALVAAAECPDEVLALALAYARADSLWVRCLNESGPCPHGEDEATLQSKAFAARDAFEEAEAEAKGRR